MKADIKAEPYSEPARSVMVSNLLLLSAVGTVVATFSNAAFNDSAATGGFPKSFVVLEAVAARRPSRRIRSGLPTMITPLSHKHHSIVINESI